MQGKDRELHYQWLEANLVFHAAHQLNLMGILAIAAYDEFIVREEGREVTEMLMHSLRPEDLPPLVKAPWNRVAKTVK